MTERECAARRLPKAGKYRFSGFFDRRRIALGHSEVTSLFDSLGIQSVTLYRAGDLFLLRGLWVEDVAGGNDWLNLGRYYLEDGAEREFTIRHFFKWCSK